MSTILRVLVADDSATVRAHARLALAAAGHVVVEAASGVEALRAVQDDPPDVAILDIAMPELDGFGVCQQFKRMGAPWDAIPIIFLTSMESHALELLGEQWGAYLHKPTRPATLLQTVEAMIGRRQAAAAAR